jgi:hypothetical protein
VVGGWEYSIVYSVATGRFLTPSYGARHHRHRVRDQPHCPAENRPSDLLRNPNLPNEEQTVARYFDTSACPAAAGPVWDIGKGRHQAPGINIFNMGLHKSFDITEKMRLRWEMTAVNMFNHPNWGQPNVNLSGGVNFGRISTIGSYDNTGIRQFRMGTRLEW